MFGNNETTPGGRALKFYSSMRFDIRKIGDIKEGDNKSGHRTRIKVVKNKCAIPFRQAEFDIVFGEGISYVGEVIDFAITENIIEKSGSWLSYAGQRIGQGRENAKILLKNDPNLLKEIAGNIHSAIEKRTELLKTTAVQKEEVEVETEDEEFTDDFAVVKG